MLKAQPVGLDPSKGSQDESDWSQDDLPDQKEDLTCSCLMNQLFPWSIKHQKTRPNAWSNILELKLEVIYQGKIQKSF